MGAHYPTVEERLAVLEQQINTLITTQEKDMTALANGQTAILKELKEQAASIGATEIKIQRDFVRLEALPCRDHVSNMQMFEKRLQIVEREIEVARVRYLAEFSPIQKMAFALVGLILTAVICAVLSTVLIRTIHPTATNLPVPVKTGP